MVAAVTLQLDCCACNRRRLSVVEVMSVWELVVWAGMSGAIALLCLVAVADCFVQRTVAAARGLAFVLMMGGAALLLSGLLEKLFSDLDFAAILPLKVAIGPLSGALTLSYLGVWLGSGQDDPVTRWAVFAGSVALVVGSGFLAMAAENTDIWTVLTWSRAINMAMVAVALFVCARAAMLGDALARWMVLACAFLGLAVMGLYAKSLGTPGWGLWAWAVTAFATVAYFLTVIALTIRRNREVRRLRQLARGLVAQNLDIPMPQGSQLIPRVADAMWRSQRLERPCVVAAIAVRNLYELGDEQGPAVEVQILAVLAARIRRHVGFRNVVGLYHPRCFVLAVSPGQDPRRGELLVESLLRAIRARVRVGPPDHRFDFWPAVGMGVVNVVHSEKQSNMDALTAINRAEQLALEDQVFGGLGSRALDLGSRPQLL
jgi:GGDEF domain-containing protein